MRIIEHWSSNVFTIMRVVDGTGETIAMRRIGVWDDATARQAVMDCRAEAEARNFKPPTPAEWRARRRRF